jgi:hypothetical protein
LGRLTRTLGSKKKNRGVCENEGEGEGEVNNNKGNEVNIRDSFGGVV